MTISTTIEIENKKGPEGNTALDEIEYWRSRSATFNTLYQQLSLQQVKDIVMVSLNFESLLYNPFKI